MDPICCNGTQYVLVDDILGKISKKKKALALHDLQLQDKDYIYVSKNQSGYNVLDKATRYKLKKLCISKEYIHRHSDIIRQYANIPRAPDEIDENYLTNIKQEQVFSREKHQYVYLVSSHHFSFVKIGIWSSCLSVLASRYRVYYGDDLELFVFEVDSSQKKGKIEKDFLWHFKDTKVSGELFHKKSYDAYISFLRQCTASHGFLWNRDEIISTRQTRPRIKLPLLPDVVELDKNDIFQFDNIMYPLKIRGTRSFDTTFFRMTDIGKLCKIKNIKDIVRNYNRGTEYVSFLNKDIHGDADTLSSNIMVNYFTTCGLYKFLGRIKNRSALHDAFTLWLTQTLITG